MQFTSAQRDKIKLFPVVSVQRGLQELIYAPVPYFSQVQVWTDRVIAKLQTCLGILSYVDWQLPWLLLWIGAVQIQEDWTKVEYGLQISLKWLYNLSWIDGQLQLLWCHHFFFANYFSMQAEQMYLAALQICYIKK